MGIPPGRADTATEPAQDFPKPQDRKLKIWSVIRVSSGNFLEMYDFMVFGYYATAIGNAYHPDSRNALDNSTKLLEQVGTDAISQVLKEFWPDIKRKFFHKGN